MFEALNQRTSFMLLVLSSSLLPSQQPLVAQYIGGRYSIAPTPNQSLILDVEFEDRQYVLGEPVWIRCSMINITPDPVKVFNGIYYGRETEHKFLLEVRNSKGEEVPRIFHAEIDYAGPETVTIAPGHRLVRAISLLDEYYVKEPGDYQVTVRYESSGQSVQRDATASKLITKKATPCRLKKNLGTIRIVNSKQKIDQDAAGSLIGKSGSVDGLGQVNSFSHMMFDRSKREGLIKDYGESLLTNYARYHDATEKLKRFKQTTAAEFASSALAQLEKIDTSGYPMLFREYVHFRLIEAHQGAASDAKQIDLQIKKFRKLFPNSPLLSP